MANVISGKFILIFNNNNNQIDNKKIYNEIIVRIYYFVFTNKRRIRI